MFYVYGVLGLSLLHAALWQLDPEDWYHFGHSKSLCWKHSSCSWWSENKQLIISTYGHTTVLETITHYSYPAASLDPLRRWILIHCEMTTAISNKQLSSYVILRVYSPKLWPQVEIPTHNMQLLTGAFELHIVSLYLFMLCHCKFVPFGPCVPVVCLSHLQWPLFRSTQLISP